MKALSTHGSYTIGIFDHRNYVIFNHAKPKTKKRKGVESIEYQYSYYSQLAHAVKEVARLTANDQCKDLRDWLEIFHRTAGEVMGVFGMGVGLVDQLDGKQKELSSPPSPLAVSACSKSEQTAA